MAKFTAALFHASGKPVELCEIANPELPGEILVRVKACTLCGSDLHTYRGARTTPTPTILGHEILGEIVHLPTSPCIDALGNPLAFGDRVVWSITVGCGACFYCNRQLPQKCHHLVKFGHELWIENGPIRGGLASHCHLPVNAVICRVPDEVPDVVACPASCATATVAACFRHLGDVAGTNVLLFGAGMLGLTAAAFAKAANAATVTVVDVAQERLQLAQRFGATHTIRAGTHADSTMAKLRRSASEEGVDIAIDMSGAISALETGLSALRKGGTFLWVGAVMPTKAIDIVPEYVVKRQLCIQGIHNYHPNDLGAAIQFLAKHHSSFPFCDVVHPRRFPLHETEEAFQFALRAKPIRVLVKCA